MVRKMLLLASIAISGCISAAPIHEAVANGNLDKVKNIVEKNSDAISQPAKSGAFKGYLPLHIAAHLGHADIAKFLIEHGFDPNTFAYTHTVAGMPIKPNEDDGEKTKEKTPETKKESQGNPHTALQLAAAQKRADVVDVLLSKGADPTRYKFDAPPLRWIIINNDIKMLKVFLQHDIDTSIPIDEEGDTLLHAAAPHLPNMVELLLEYGANPNVENNKSLTPLHKAAGSLNALIPEPAKKSLSIVQMLIKAGAHVDAQGQAGVTPLYLATRSGATSANPDSEEDQGAAAIHLRVIQLLLDKGANPNIEIYPQYELPTHFHFDDFEEYGGTPIHIVTFAGNRALLEKLIQAGARVDNYNKSGFTPLHIATDATIVDNKTAFSLAKVLVQAGADVNALARESVTPLHNAVINGYEPIVRYLIHQGANVHIQTANGATPLHYAADKNEELIAILIGNDANVHSRRYESKDSPLSKATPLYEAAWKLADDTIPFFVDQGADINVRCADDKTPLHTVAQGGLLHIARSEDNFKKKISNIAGDASYGSIAQNMIQAVGLDKAEQRKLVPLAQTLINQGAKINAQDAYGHTPLYLAAQEGYSKLVKTLLEQEADPSIQTKNGKTPLDIAKEHDHEEIVTILQKHTKQKT